MSENQASYFYAQFHRVARRRGRNKAAIAVAHSILTAVYHVLRTGLPYAELCVDCFDRLDATTFADSSNLGIR
jgi:transposase